MKTAAAPATQLVKITITLRTCVKKLLFFGTEETDYYVANSASELSSIVYESLFMANIFNKRKSIGMINLQNCISLYNNN